MTGKTYIRSGIRAFAWLQKAECDTALADFSEAIRIDPSDAYSLWRRGQCWLKKDETDKAIVDLDEAIRLNSKAGEAFSCRGTCWADKEEYDKAIADFSEAITPYPEKPDEFQQPGELLG